MQVEITLEAPPGASYSARDLGYLLGKHPDRLYERDVSGGRVSVFYTAAGDRSAAAVLYLDLDPIALARGANRGSEGLLGHYVNDRPYVANSFLSVALGRAYNQAMAGKSKERQTLADRTLPLEARVVPVAISGGAGIANLLFDPLGYATEALPLGDSGGAALCEIRIAGAVRLQDLLRHLYVLIPVLDNRKHYWVSDDEVRTLVRKGEGWLADHPAKGLIARRSLRHARNLANLALARLAEAGADDRDSSDGDGPPASEREETLEQPFRLHDLRHERVVDVLRDRGTASILDLGCGEGRLLRRLARESWPQRIVGVDASVASVERAARLLRPDGTAQGADKRVSLQVGSLTYGDRRWRGFDAATLVEVIEHLDPSRLPSLERAVFGDARPRVVLVTTPNREYNALYPTLEPGAFRHADHRFEWTRAECRAWAERVAAKWRYAVEISPVGPEDGGAGAPSQMAVFDRGSGEGRAA